MFHYHIFYTCIYIYILYICIYINTYTDIYSYIYTMCDTEAPLESWHHLLRWPTLLRRDRLNKPTKMGGEHVTDRSSMQNKQANVVPKINVENKCRTQNNVNLDTITQNKCRTSCVAKRTSIKRAQFSMETLQGFNTTKRKYKNPVERTLGCNSA